jgi:glycosyltransferase involved in cell wall biosynthesis
MRATMVVPLYNKGPYVRRAIASVLAQTVSDIEVVVVNDGSTDDGPQIVGQIGDPRVRLIHQPNAGVSAARNRGIEEARCDVVGFLDADDELSPEFLAVIMRMRQDYPRAQVFATSYEIVQEGSGPVVPEFDLPDYGLLTLSDYIRLFGKTGCSPVWSSAIVCDRSALEAAGGFPVGQSHGEDLDTWFALLKNNACAYCNKPYSRYYYYLPLSACTCLPSDIDGSVALTRLQREIASGLYSGKELDEMVLYVAIRRSFWVRSLVMAGMPVQARACIRQVQRAKPFATRFRKWFWLSCLPTWVVTGLLFAHARLHRRCS